MPCLLQSVLGSDMYYVLHHFPIIFITKYKLFKTKCNMSEYSAALVVLYHIKALVHIWEQMKHSPCILLLLWKTASFLSTELGSVQKCLIFSSRYQLWFSSTRVNIITNSRSTSVLVPEYLFSIPIRHNQRSKEKSPRWNKSRCVLWFGHGLFPPKLVLKFDSPRSRIKRW